MTPYVPFVLSFLSHAYGFVFPIFIIYLDLLPRFETVKPSEFITENQAFQSRGSQSKCLNVLAFTSRPYVLFIGMYQNVLMPILQGSVFYICINFRLALHGRSI